MNSISIAMCTYNGGKFIRDQLESLKSQTKPPCEIVICDDLSTDDTLEIIRDFAAYAEFRVRVHVNTERLGYRKNFMQAASLCKGDLIAFCDQDDIWREDKLHLVDQAFSDPDVIMVHHNARLIWADGKPFGQVNEQGDFSSISRPMSQNPWRYPLGFTETFRSNLSELNNLREEIMGEEEHEWTAHDQWIAFLSSALGKTVYIDDCLADYRQHGKNTYGRVNSVKPKSLPTLISEKIGSYKDYNVLKTVSERRSMVLQKINENSAIDERWRQQSRISSEIYDAISLMYGDRSDVYSNGNIIFRFLSWNRMIYKRMYSKYSDVHFTSKSAMRDFFQGVLFARLKNKTAPTDDYSVIIL